MNLRLRLYVDRKNPRKQYKYEKNFFSSDDDRSGSFLCRCSNQQ